MNTKAGIKVISLSSLLLFTACQTIQQAVFDSGKLEQIDASIEKAIADGKTPGGVFWLERHDQVYSKAYGNMALDPEKPPPLRLRR